MASDVRREAGLREDKSAIEIRAAERAQGAQGKV